MHGGLRCVANRETERHHAVGAVVRGQRVVGHAATRVTAASPGQRQLVGAAGGIDGVVAVEVYMQVVVYHAVALRSVVYGVGRRGVVVHNSVRCRYARDVQVVACKRQVALADGVVLVAVCLRVDGEVQCYHAVAALRGGECAAVLPHAVALSAAEKPAARADGVVYCKAVYRADMQRDGQNAVNAVHAHAAQGVYAAHGSGHRRRGVEQPAVPAQRQMVVTHGGVGTSAGVVPHVQRVVYNAVAPRGVGNDEGVAGGCIVAKAAVAPRQLPLDNGVAYPYRRVLIYRHMHGKGAVGAMGGEHVGDPGTAVGKGVPIPGQRQAQAAHRAVGTCRHVAPHMQVVAHHAVAPCLVGGSDGERGVGGHGGYRCAAHRQWQRVLYCGVVERAVGVAPHGDTHGEGAVFAVRGTGCEGGNIGARRGKSVPVPHQGQVVFAHRAVGGVPHIHPYMQRIILANGAARGVGIHKGGPRGRCRKRVSAVAPRQLVLHYGVVTVGYHGVAHYDAVAQGVCASVVVGNQGGVVCGGGGAHDYAARRVAGVPEHMLYIGALTWHHRERVGLRGAYLAGRSGYSGTAGVDTNGYLSGEVVAQSVAGHIGEACGVCCCGVGGYEERVAVSRKQYAGGGAGISAKVPRHIVVKRPLRNKAPCLGGRDVARPAVASRRGKG